MGSANGNRQAEREDDDNRRPEQRLARASEAALAFFVELCLGAGFTLESFQYSEVSYALFEGGVPVWVIAVTEIFRINPNASVIQPFVTTTTQDHVDENGDIVTTTRRVLNISY